MEQEIRAAARHVIARMARLSAENSPECVVRYESLLAQLALAQIALAHPRASLGTCIEHGTPLHFCACADDLYVCCGDGPAEHGWKIA